MGAIAALSKKLGPYSVVSGVLFLKRRGELAVWTFFFNEREGTQGLGHSWR